MTASKSTAPSVQLRQAVRPHLHSLAPASLVLVACSGGADSLALAKAVFLEAQSANLSAGAVIVDHGWHERSSEVTLQTRDTLEEVGLIPLVCITLPPHPKNESAARELRYAALAQAAKETGAVKIFTGHTQNDQAETLLMRLARGSGTTSLAGIPTVRDIFVRPLLAISREITQAACDEWGLKYWSDPANEDVTHTRVRVRKIALPALTEALGTGVETGLARSAQLLRDDAEVLDSLAKQLFDLIFDTRSQVLEIEKLIHEPKAIARRVLINWAHTRGVPRQEMNANHAYQLYALLLTSHESMRVALPGGFVAWRSDMVLKCEVAPL